MKIKKAYKKPKNQKGQASIEFLILFAVSIVILSILSWLTYEQIADINIKKENSESYKLLLDISNTAKEVYMQGEGASKIIVLSFPETYNSTYSGIINNSILIRTMETTLVETMEFPISGALPESEGMHEMVFTSRGNSVYIGTALYKPSVYLVSSVLPPTSVKATNITLTNLVNEYITVNGTVYWPHTGASLVVSDLNFNIAPYQDKIVTITISSTTTTGSYVGYINFSAASSNVSDNQTISIYAEVH
ncbi:MAG: class III signal peptide-containing protein [Candidatus Micrarchaeota archaeon]